MIRFQIINLLPKHGNPKILANKFHHIQMINKPCSIFCQFFHDGLTDSVAY